MKERPILMNTVSVQGILGGRKTQTRRIIKNPEKYEGLMLKGEASEWCPYGKVGDRLWVRETWAFINMNPPIMRFKANKEDWWYSGKIPIDKIPELSDKWKPSIFMPHWASRITLEITDIRVESMQDISHKDAISEGYIDNIEPNNYGTGSRARDWFAEIWDSINGRGAWERNDFVWVVEFKMVTQ